MPKPRLCRCGCEQAIPAGNTLRKWATVDCALKLVAADRAKKERKALSESRKQTRADRARIKTRGEWAKEAQAAVNAYVRERDRLEPCICCQRYHNGQYHAAHYRSVGSNPAIRYELLNINKSCQPCNTHLSGNLIEYRINLICKIGQAAVDFLEGPHAPKQYTIDDLKEIKARFAKMRKALEMERL